MPVGVPRTRSLWATLRHPELWVGLASGLLIAFTTITVRQAPLLPLPAPLVAARAFIKGELEQVLVVAGVAGLIAAWIALRPRQGGRPAPSFGLVAIVWSLPLVFSLPSFTDDVWAYLDQGWQLMRGVSPYVVGLTDAGGPFARFVDPWWVHTTSAYPPLALRFNQLAVFLAGPSPLWAVVVLRVFSVGALFVIAWGARRLVPASVARPDVLSWLLLVNPFLLLEGVFSAHTEIIMVAVAVLAFVVARTRGGLFTGSALLAVAAALKQPAALLAPALALTTIPAAMMTGGRLRVWGALAWRTAVAGVIGVASFIAASWACGLGWGWVASATTPSSRFTPSPTFLLQALIDALSRTAGHAGGHVSFAKVSYVLLALGLVAILAATLVYSRTGSWARLAWVTSAIYIVVSPSLWPWYAIPVVVFMAFDSHAVIGPRLAVCTSIALAGYSVVGGEVFGKTPSLVFFVLLLILVLRYAPRLPELAPELPHQTRWEGDTPEVAAP